MEYEKLIAAALKMGEAGDLDALEDCFELIRAQEVDGSVRVASNKSVSNDVVVYDPVSFAAAHGNIKKLRSICANLVKHGDGYSIELYKKCLLFDAPHFLDEAILYAEFDRPYEKKFYEPRRKQLKRVVDAMQRLEERKIHSLGVMMPPGVGKALANDTPVLTRNGWKNHGDLLVGDEVIGMDGKFKKVLYVHPKCMLDCMVEFTNGEKIQCHENHEWLFYDRARGKRYKKTHLEETKVWEKRTLEIGGDLGNRGHRYVLQVPKCCWVLGEEKELPIDPYVLGVWLGDGVNTNPTICGAKSDHAIIDEIVRRGYSPRWSSEHKTTGVMYYGFDFRKQLQLYGMCHSRKTVNKYIPDEFLTASVKQRLDLLAGLLDTDGCLVKGRSDYQFTTSEESLKNGFISLVSTFGWKCCVQTKKPSTSSSGITGRKDHFVIKFCPNAYIPCVLERKQLHNFAEVRKIGVKSITRVDPKEGNCITVEGDGMYLAGKTMLPTHNTTLEISYMIWSGLRNPNKSILMGSHSNSLLSGVYGEILRMLDSDGEYHWRDIFPSVPLTGTNAKDMRIDLGTRKRFETFEFASVGAGNAGRVRASNLLCLDDLVDGIESAMSRDRMDKLWQQFYTDYLQRQMDDCALLMVATPWSLADPIDRLEEMHSDDPDAEFIHLPALNENDESNFQYPCGVGFSTEFYHAQREIMDDASWRALYMCQPIERDAILYDEEELRVYFDLPEREPDAIVSVCDTKEQGNDYCVMPIAYQYGQDFYIDSFICDNGKPDIIEKRIVNMLCDRGVHMARFESNRGGTLFAENVQNGVKAKNGRTRITTKWNQTNKETRIIVNSGWVKSHCLFRAESCRDREYKTAMNFLTGYSMAGKNKHDDVPDAMADLADFTQSYQTTTATIMHRPF